MFEEFIELCDEQYEYGLIEFKNGDIVNMPGENDGSAKVLSYAALAGFDKDMTLKVNKLHTMCHSLCTTIFYPFRLLSSSGDNITETCLPLLMGMITKTSVTS